MLYLKNYNEFKLNEGLLDGLMNFFKGLWKKISAELQKLEDDPNKIKEYIINNCLNLSSPNNLFKNEFDAYQKSDGSDKATFDFIDTILNKDTGILGKQGIGTLFNDKSLQGDKMKAKRITFEYIIKTARDIVIKKLKFDQKRIEDLKDTTYMPSLKEALKKEKNDTPADIKTKKDNIINWTKTNIITELINNVKAIREDDIKAIISKNGVSLSEEYKVGDVVRYKMDSFEEGTEPDKQPDNVGTLKINKINGDDYTFVGKHGTTFTKTKDQIIGKEKVDDSGDKNVVDDLKSKLANIKTDKNKMDKVDKLVDLLNTPEGEQKIDNILTK